MLRGLSEPPYFTWLRNLLHLSATDEADGHRESPQPQFLVRFLSELPELWKTDSRQRVRRITEQVRQQAGQLLARGTPAPERHLLMQSLNLTLIRMSGELDKSSVVSWCEPVADRICRHAESDAAAHELLTVTLNKSLRNPNPFIQLSALLALNRMGAKPDLESVSLHRIAEPDKTANPELSDWINRLQAGEAAYPDPRSSARKRACYRSWMMMTRKKKAQGRDRQL